MFSLNRIDIIGYQTQPVTLRTTPAGTSVTDLNLVVPFSFRNQKGETTSARSFHTVTLWGPMADIAGQYVRPGTQLFLSGRLQTDSWEDQETKEKRSKTKIVALDMILLDPKDGQAPAPTGAPLLTSGISHATIVGNVTKDPELRTTTGGQQVLSFGVATNERWKDKGSGETKERTEFHNVVAWGDLAQQLSVAVKKGSRLHVSGRVQTRTWETQTGQKRATTEIVADHATLLGVQNADARASVQADSAAVPRAAAQAPASAESHTSSDVSAPPEIPAISYESEIKPEDLPF